MQLLSQASQYAVSAVIALAREPRGTAVSAADLAKPLRCPAAYLSQTLAKLNPRGIIDSRRGLGGGVFLRKDPSEIYLYDIVSAIDGEDFFTRCFMGIEGCGHIEPCPFHSFWSITREEIADWMKMTSIAQASEEMTDTWFDLRLQFHH